MPHIQRALISVSDKTGIADFARALRSLGRAGGGHPGIHTHSPVVGIIPLKFRLAGKEGCCNKQNSE